MSERLFRYVGVSGDRWQRLLDIVLKRELFYSSPVRFNDPFDCVVDIAENLPTSVLRAFGRSQLSVLNPDLRGAELEGLLDRWVADMQTPDGLRKIVASVQESVSNAGVVCLSARPDVPLMWAHYAEAHTGVALEFTRSDSNFLRYAKPVEYADSYVAAALDGDSVDLGQRILFTKASYWAYEQEWRVFNLRFCNACRPIEPGALTGLILGLRTGEQTEERIRDVLRTAPDEIRLYRAERAKGHFGLVVRDAV